MVKKRGLILNDLIASTAKEKTQKTLKGVIGALYNQRFLPDKYRDVPTDVFVWDDNVALFALEEPLFGTLITNRHLADTFRMLFDLAWQSSGE